MKTEVSGYVKKPGYVNDTTIKINATSNFKPKMLIKYQLIIALPYLTSFIKHVSCKISIESSKNFSDLEDMIVKKDSGFLSTHKII